MHLVMLDTCVWLDISSQKSELPMLTAIEHLVEMALSRSCCPDLVRTSTSKIKGTG